MIPRPYVAKWRKQAPWSLLDQVEQDLIICRALIAIFSDDFLSEQLAFRGGTALHKLYLNPAPRYSEDIDLVQVREGPIKPILKRIGEVITFFEEERVVKQKANNNTILYRFNSEYTPERRMRLKIEINCREHFNVFGWNKFPYQIENEWFTGEAMVTTYDVNELLGTKLRALYQRKKGRDLFDLYYADQNLNLDYEKIIYAYREYMRFVVKKVPTKKQFLLNIKEKAQDTYFSEDIGGLLRTGVAYNQQEAFDWIVNKIADRF